MIKISSFLTTALILIFILTVSSANAQRKRAIKKATAHASVQKPERNALENSIRNYLLKNPEVIREAMQALQMKEELQRNTAVAGNIKKFNAAIYTDAESPVAGNKSGDVSVVIFYDYFCGYCKRTLPALQALVAKDASVKIIFKEFPILGPQSTNAAKAALAAARQGKFEAFHQAMLESDSAGDEALKAIADKIGIDYVKLQKDMTDPTIIAAIDRNIRLAGDLNINGTPAYLIGGQFVPGAVDADALAKLVNEERTKLANLDKEKTAAKGMD